MKKNHPDPSPVNAQIFFGLAGDLIVILFVTRIVFDTSIRMFTPFLPEFALGLGLSITTFSWFLTIRSVMGLVTPFIGALADRYGRRLIIVVALLLRSVGLYFLSVTSGWLSLIPLLLLSFSAASYFPVLRAYVSDLAAPQRRARALAIVDAAFPAAGILGLPLVGGMIESFGWDIPLLVLAGLTLVTAIMTGFRLPPTKPTQDTSGILKPMIALIKDSRIIVSLLVSALVLMIFTIFFLFWALLLKERFGYSPLDIGLTGTKIGVAELVGLLIAGLVVDRIGKRKGTLIGFGASAVIFPFFLLVQNSIVLIHALLVFFMFAFEFGITATIPLIAEQTDSNRATLFCMVSLGNTIGAGLGPPLVAYLWALGGSLAVGITTSILLVVMVLLVFYYLFDKETPEGEELVSIA